MRLRFTYVDVVRLLVGLLYGLTLACLLISCYWLFDLTAVSVLGYLSCVVLLCSWWAMGIVVCWLGGLLATLRFGFWY